MSSETRSWQGYYYKIKDSGGGKGSRDPGKYKVDFKKS